MFQQDGFGAGLSNSPNSQNQNQNYWPPQSLSAQHRHHYIILSPADRELFTRFVGAIERIANAVQVPRSRKVLQRKSRKARSAGR